MIDADRLYRRVSLRIVPFLFVCYVFAYLDRVNVGFAKLRMLDDLGFSEAAYGLGAGVFFIGYVMFEVPSNLLMLRIGARRTIARIMIAWGGISASMMFVTSDAVFYVLRFLLGVAEAGFFPGVIYYLTCWFPAARRGRVIALFATAVAVSIVIGAPVSGLILQHLDGLSGLAGWQWLFLIEGLPSIALGVLALRLLDDVVSQARWLSAEERNFITDELDRERRAIEHVRIVDGLRLPRVWLIGVIYFAIVMGLYGLNFWLPTIVQELGYVSMSEIGLVTAVPFGTAAVAMVLIGRSADRRAERRWHTAVPVMCGAAGLVASVALAADPAFAIAALAIGASGILGGVPQAWGLATSFLSGGAAAVGIALINSLGNLAGFVAPLAIGLIKDATGSTAAGVVMLAVSMVAGGLLVLRLPAATTSEHADALVPTAAVEIERS
ncbi:MAG: MFS transporter [Bradyrhizobium sp.]|uniref:MFS transporter n=1 Tax=Bradyrhizobium sp. TaxID=376 RepID=UPI003D1234A7